jgi:hypothetical protein
MAQDTLAPADPPEIRPFTNPWPALSVGLTATAVAGLTAHSFTHDLWSATLGLRDHLLIVAALLVLAYFVPARLGYIGLTAVTGYLLSLAVSVSLVSRQLPHVVTLAAAALIAAGAAFALRPKAPDRVHTAAWSGLLALAAMAFGLYGAGTGWALPLVLGGAVATGAAVAIRPQSPLVLGLAALSGVCAIYGMPWDSIRLVLAVLTSLAALATVLMLLPQAVRRVAVLLLVLFHFGGIFSAVTSVSPTPWLSQYIWANVYQPYLEFMYLNNAYHFYSPEPGPGINIRFYIKYEDDSGQWYRIPSWEDHTVALEYQRQLSFCESFNQITPGNNLNAYAMARRQAAINNTGFLGHPWVPPEKQFFVPTWYSKKMMENYARYVARHKPHPTNPDIKVASVKIYRVTHNILTPAEMARGEDPDNPRLYLAFYQGEFSPDGELLDANDPLLYWMIPVMTREEAEASVNQIDREYRPRARAMIEKAATKDDPNLIDYVQAHATQ